MSQYRNALIHHRTFVFLSCLILGGARLSAGDSPWYLQLKLGPTDADVELGSRSPKHFEGDQSAGSVEVGYFLNPYLAVQAGYHELGEFQGQGSPCPDDAEVCVALVPGCIEGDNPICEGPASLVPLSAELSGFSLALVPRWPIHERFSVFGKLGFIAWDADVFGSSGSGVGRIDSFSDRGLMTGLGVQYTFPKGLGLVVEYQKLDLDLEQTSLGASWRF